MDREPPREDWPTTGSPFTFSERIPRSLPHARVQGQEQASPFTGRETARRGGKVVCLKCPLGKFGPLLCKLGLGRGNGHLARVNSKDDLLILNLP